MDLQDNLAQMLTMIERSVGLVNHIYAIKGVKSVENIEYLCPDPNFAKDGRIWGEKTVHKINVNFYQTECPTVESLLYH